MMALMVLTPFTAHAQNPVGFYGYGPTFSWGNHLSINPAGNLVIAGTSNSDPGFIITNSAGAYLAGRRVGNDYGELFTSVIQSNGDFYVGGMGGFIGSEVKYIVKYSAGLAQLFARQYGPGSIRYMIQDGTNIAACGFEHTNNASHKPSILKIDNAGNLIYHKRYTINGSNATGYALGASGGAYYMTGSIKGSGTVASYILCADAATGNVNWCRTYVGAAFSPHFTGMAISPSGITVCGTTGENSDGDLVVMKTDFSGNVQWTRRVVGAHSWYNRAVDAGFSWAINCAVDAYGAVVVAFEETAANNRGGLLAKLNGTTGGVLWIKKYKTSNGDGFHGITTSGCTYLGSGWFHSTNYKFGLVVTDTSGFAGASCATNVTKTSSAPTLTVVSVTATSTNLTAAGNYANASNTTLSWTRSTSCSGTSTTCSIPLPVELLSFNGVVNCDEATVQLQWVTATETNNSHFSLESSVDGVVWEHLGHVNDVAGNSMTMTAYSFNAPLPPGSPTYYRLTQEDMDGNAEHVGGILAVPTNCRGLAQGASLYFDQGSDQLHVQFSSPVEGELRFMVHDALGRRVLDRQERIQRGENAFRYDLSRVATGAYVCSFGSDRNLEPLKFIRP